MSDALMDEVAAMRAALNEFCETIEKTGGVYPDGVGYSPVQTRDEYDSEAGWYDLGHAYMAACKSLGRKPMTVDEELSDDDE